ncbi:flagellar biosynthetic protein FliO [Bartonella doshiae]|uniref:Flagellar biosynthetic protein FliO n=2 Tax=Bartonella doshiae TaxID=33044 RepID=A0A380ZD00_BARDO|nr:flagellar biosynthetic protein FliO [Bartonella doshiae]EJF81766.1 hypothetical protein MCS_00191 [Bartonella doshiae NCTC 12862 = ATCC 700133]MBB6159797.1 hypothetical protein [Bartonella doshiae]SUV44807.1 flagellar biosynthetic protein FliO [Bartonella doshiae]
MHIWLSSQIGTYAANVIMILVFFIITIAIIGTIFLFLRRLNTRGFIGKRKKHQLRLKLCDAIDIDRTRRLILVRCDEREHLILIGGTKDIVVESNITSMPIVQKSIQKQKRGMQLTSTITEADSNPKLEENILLSTNEKKHMQEDISTSFMNQHLEDSAITAEIEGRQEPSLFIPAQRK